MRKRMLTRWVHRPVAPALVLALSVVALAPGVRAEAPRVSAAARGEYLYNTDLGASVFDARVDLDVEIAPLTLGTTYRAYHLSDPHYDPAAVVARGSEIKHRFAEFRREDLFLRAGDFLCTFGNGLVLRSFEDIDLEHDTALDGLLMEYSRGPVDVTGLSGTLTEEHDSGTYLDYTVRAARARASAAGLVSVAGSVVERAEREYDRDDLTIARSEDAVLGGEVEAWLGPVHLVAEYASRDTAAEGGAGGHGAYLAGSGGTSWLTFLGEYKDYDGFEHPLTNPPTCVREHPWTLMNRATHEVNRNDEKGFLVEGTFTVFDELTVLGGCSEARTHNGGLVHWEIYGELDHWFLDSAPGSVAWSWSREYVGQDFTERMIGALGWDVTVGRGRTVEIAVEGQRTDEPGIDTYEDLLASVALYVSPAVTFVALGEGTNSEYTDDDSWLFAEARVLLADDLEVSIGCGTERGGTKCSGGICYTEPDFEGVRVRVSTFF